MNGPRTFNISRRWLKMGGADLDPSRARWDREGAVGPRGGQHLPVPSDNLRVRYGLVLAVYHCPGYAVLLRSSRQKRKKHHYPYRQGGEGAHAQRAG
jgi:hypothetical protein